MLSFQVGYVCVLGLIIHRFFMKMHTVRFYLLTILQSKVPLPSYLWEKDWHNEDIVLGFRKWLWKCWVNILSVNWKSFFQNKVFLLHLSTTIISLMIKYTESQKLKHF